MVSVGVDIGGMSAKIALVKDGKILSRTSVKAVKGEKYLYEIAGAIERLIARKNLTKNDIASIGVGCPGAVTSSTGVVEFSSNLKWNKMPVGKILSEQLGMSVKVCNDANVATYSEAIYGAGKKYNTVIMLTLGTGVGGGIVIDKKLYEGNGSKAGEVGHTTLVLGGEKCNCGRSGCCEAYVSASALIRDTKRAMMEDRESLMWQVAKSLDGVDGTTACECAKLGDKTAIKVYDNYANYLAETIMNFCNIFRPEAIILGGGISNHGKFLFEKVRKICKKNYYGYKGTPEVKIVCARLKNDAGVIGAAIL